MKARLIAVVLFAVALAAAEFASGASAQGGGAQQPQASTHATSTTAATGVRGLTPQERRGRAIYMRGESPSGSEITAMVGELDVPASTVTCAGCHGARGEGKTEGGVTAGNLTWPNLTKTYGHTHPTGRKHGPFNEAAFVRALTDGVDPAGNSMLAAMPRFKMSPEDAADLIAYVKRIEEDHDPGVGDASVKLGTLLPSTGPLAETGSAMRDVLAAFFEELNARGGIYSRKVELQVADTGTSATTAATSARRLVEQGQVFAAVGGLSAGADKELAALAQEQEVPFVGPSTLMPQVGFGTNRYIFYLLPGIAEQARALVNFGAQRQTVSKAGAAVVFQEGEIGSAAAAAVEDQCRKIGCGELKKVSYARGKFDAASLVQASKGAGTVFFISPGGEESAFLKEADAAAWRPDVLLLGALTGRDFAATVPAGFNGKVFLAFPTVPSDITPAGESELRALSEKYKFQIRHTAAQLSALAAAKVLAEGLQRAGKDLSREKLVTSLEGLYDYETGLTPRVTFGPNRRVGAAGAYMVTVNTETKQFALAGEWVKAN